MPDPPDDTIEPTGSPSTIRLMFPDRVRSKTVIGSLLSLQSERVDHRREHAHVVGGRAVHAAGARRETAEDVAPADDDRDLDAERRDVAHLGGHPREHLRIDPVALAAGERFPRQLQDDTAVRRARGPCTRRHPYPASPTRNRAKRLTTTRSPVLAFTPSTKSRTRVLPAASLTKGCSSLPSTILSMICGGFF